MPLRVGINGLGRIGRQFVRTWLEQHRGDFEIVAANDLTDIETLAHLLRHDSIYGSFPMRIEVARDGLRLEDAGAGGAGSKDGTELRIFGEADPAAIPWHEAGVDVVVEATGLFREPDKARKHLHEGVRRVVISTNAHGDGAFTLIYGVNHDQYDPAEHRVISAGSCTTNCVVPMADVLHREFGIRSGFLTTVHSYTASQNLVDAKHGDLRRARAAAENIVPTSTGAVRALGKVLPALEGVIDGIAMRVPTSTGSITDLVTELEHPPDSAEAINAAFEAAAAGRLRGILVYETDELVSSDVQGLSASSIFDAPLTSVRGPLAKNLSWYDNEWGYASRIGDVCALIAEREAA